MDADLRDQVQRVQLVHPRAGYRTVRQYIYLLGIRVGECGLRRVMGKFGLQACLKRAFVRTRDSKHSHRVYPNLIKRILVSAIDQIWVSDITGIREEKHRVLAPARQGGHQKSERLRRQKVSLSQPGRLVADLIIGLVADAGKKTLVPTETPSETLLRP